MSGPAAASGAAPQRLALLTVAEMAQADAAAVAAGVAGGALMEAAGAAVAREILAHHARGPVLVLCGPGNNGGDGFVVARRLAEAGWPVEVALLGSRDALAGDAALTAARWTGRTVDCANASLAAAPLIVDALFGAGLTRPVEGAARAMLEAAAARRLTSVAVDLPSGVQGDTGEVLGTALPARRTVTFFRPKPGHYLLPGRGLVGTLVVADIGIPERVLEAVAPRAALNDPELWLDRYPWAGATDNKYSRGHAVIAGGARMTGAARLAARGARRIGAGLVTVASPADAAGLYAADAPGLLVDAVPDADAFAALLDDARKNAILLGPGLGVDGRTRAFTLAALRTGRACVLDADALTAFAGEPDRLVAAIAGPCLLTPHEGELRRLFPDCAAHAGKLARARDAARRSGAVVLLKGADTIVAAPDSRALVNANAPPELATAGSGDVLAGFALGLIAQGMPAFEAAAAAAWLHGAAGATVGPGLIAEDLPEALPAVLRRLRSRVRGP